MRLPQHLFVSAALVVALAAIGAQAQQPQSDVDQRANQRAEEADRAASQAATPRPAAAAVAARPQPESIVDWFYEGGIFMWPILGFSLLSVMFMIERAIGLRREKIIPSGLVKALGEAAGEQGSFDPRKAYRICQQFPSAAASVIKVMLLKIGRPHSEVEHAVAESKDREANRLHTNVRWLTLSAAIAPLLGLIGTVQGMIMAFRRTTELVPGQNVAVELATGIYTALITTFAGLCVAIPATIFAHWFEGRIQGLFRDIDELLFNLLPQVERYEGKLRVSRVQLGEGGEPVVETAAAEN
jgi:biopolymer transport protein ExbB